MKITLIRNATLWLEYGGLSWLVDPSFADQGSTPAIPHVPDSRPNPLVPLPVTAESLSSPDVLLLTHLHPDHWDEPAAEALLAGRNGSALPILAQPGDRERIAAFGFSHVTEIEGTLTYEDVTITRTSGQHGVGEIGQKMGQVSGFVFRADNEPTLYIAGDTIWCDDVVQALDAHHPDVTVVNAGGAQFGEGDAIVMTPEDVASVCRHDAHTAVVAVHLEAINHCRTSREMLANEMKRQGFQDRVRIPADGETLTF